MMDKLAAFRENLRDKFVKPEVREIYVKEDDASFISSDADSSIPKDAHAGELDLVESAAGGLGRHLGISSTTFLIIGRIIGTGIFSTPASILTSVGSVGASMLLWVAGLILSFAGLAIWLEFGCMIPRSGGEKVYLEAVYIRPKLLATTLFAFQAVLLGFTASGCIVFASNIVVAAGRTATEWEKRGIAILVISAVTVLHTFFPGWGVRAMNGVGLIKIFTLCFIVVTGWVILGRGTNIQDPQASFRDAFAGSAVSGNLYATAMFKVLNSYAGWSNAAYVLNEVKNPVRTLKIAGPLGLSICGVLYVLANVAYFAAAPPAVLKKTGINVASVFMGQVFGKAGQTAIRRVLQDIDPH